MEPSFIAKDFKISEDVLSSHASKPKPKTKPKAQAKPTPKAGKGLMQLCK